MKVMVTGGSGFLGQRTVLVMIDVVGFGPRPFAEGMWLEVSLLR